MTCGEPAPGKKGRLLAAGAGCVAAALGIGFAFGMRPAWLTQNDVTTGRSAAYPEITPHEYAEPPEQVFAVLRACAGRVPRWRVVRTDPGTRAIAVEVRTALFRFTDDLTARVEAAGSGSRVVIRSHSRVGRGDLGENARHIAALQVRLDRQLTRRPAAPGGA